MLRFKNNQASELNMNKKIVLGSLILLFLLIIPLTYAEQYTYTISNSAKWTDVYSSIMYSNLQGIQNKFLTSTADGNVIIKELNKDNFVRVLSSTTEPYAFNYPDSLKSAGFKGADEIKSSDMNLDLIKDLPDIKNFIVVGDSFGYNSLAVAPYAIKEHTWVFLANKENIYQISSILSKRNVKSLLIYGYVNPTIRNVLSKYNPRIIDTGNRFSDNIEIVKEYLKLHSTKQVVLTNGGFIEQEIMGGYSPVLFTGKQNVPSQISEWLKNSNIKVGVLIGNNLISAATNIRRKTGISVIVKFARNARDQAGGVSPVEGLDMFPVPTPSMNLNLHSVDYNKKRSVLDITYKSNSNIPVYMKGTISINNSGKITKIGDLYPIFISPGEFKTIEYPLNLTPSKNLNAEIYTLYGETKKGLEFILDNVTKINIIEVIDACTLTKKDIRATNYNKQQGEILIKIRNPNKINCWVRGEIQDIKIGYSTKTLGSEGTIIIPAKRTRTLVIKQKLSETDLQNNPSVNERIYSGERKDTLVNSLFLISPLGVELLTPLTYLIIAIIFIIIGLIILFIILKKKQKEYY